MLSSLAKGTHLIWMELCFESQKLPLSVHSINQNTPWRCVLYIVFYVWCKKKTSDDYALSKQIEAGKPKYTKSFVGIASYW